MHDGNFRAIARVSSRRARLPNAALDAPEGAGARPARPVLAQDADPPSAPTGTAQRLASGLPRLEHAEGGDLVAIFA
jgi:hypothetical protein